MDVVAVEMLDPLEPGEDLHGGEPGTEECGRTERHRESVAVRSAVVAERTAVDREQQDGAGKKCRAKRHRRLLRKAREDYR